jgi:hypothetical protein
VSIPNDDSSGLFIPGREVRVREAFEGLACRFETGERLRCERRWLSRYDSTWLYEFRRSNGQLLVWPLDDGSPPPKWWHVRFEAVE